jgi:hypothetical protein
MGIFWETGSGRGIRKNFGWKKIKEGVFENNTYLFAVETCFKNRRFSLEILRPGKYMKIKSEHSKYS